MISKGIKRKIDLFKTLFNKEVKAKDFKQCGINVYVSHNVRIFNPENISLANNIYFGPGSTLF